MNRMNHYEIISARDAHLHALLTPEENKHLQQYRRRKLCILWAKPIKNRCKRSGLAFRKSILSLKLPCLPAACFSSIY